MGITSLLGKIVLVHDNVICTLVSVTLCVCVCKCTAGLQILGLGLCELGICLKLGGNLLSMDVLMDSVDNRSDRVLILFTSAAHETVDSSFARELLPSSENTFHVNIFRRNAIT